MLRDTLLRVAAADCYRAHWSLRILDEVTRNLISDYGMEPDRAGVLRTVMEEAFPDANVEGWEPLEPAMRNHPKDRHVAAAAAAVGAGIIVTSNIRDFSDLPPGIVAMTPDDFLVSLLSKGGGQAPGGARRTGRRLSSTNFVRRGIDGKAIRDCARICRKDIVHFKHKS